MRNYLRLVRAHPIFSEVAELDIFPYSSQVLQKRDGYRESLQIYRLIHLSRTPLFDLIQDAIDNRRIDQLYEFWCLFSLAERLATNKGFTFKPILDPDQGLPWGLEAHFGNGFKLVYNKQFTRRKGSYSVPLRPDFSLFCEEKLCAVFDAKFRFYESDLERIGAKSLSVEIEWEDRNEEIERDFEETDIHKMHAYRYA